MPTYINNAVFRAPDGTLIYVTGQTGQTVYLCAGTSSNTTVLPCAITTCCTSASSTTWYTAPLQNTVAQRRELTPEELEAERVQQAAAAQRNREREAIRKADNERRAVAEARAKQLLLDHLTPEQQETFNKNKWFVVEGGKTKKKYRVQCDGGIAGNILLLEDEKPKERWCCHADQRLMPNHDHWLAQKLLLEHDEENFTRIANKTRVA